MHWPLRVVLCACLLALAHAAAFSQALYWDANGSTAGAGGAAPSGSWNLSLGRWNDRPGTGAPVLWGNTGLETAIFAAGTDATGSYVVTLDAGTALNVTAIQVQSGQVTLTPAGAGDYLEFGAATATLQVASGSGLNVAASLHGTAGLLKTGTGTLTLSGANVLTGGTALRGGSTVLDYAFQNNAKLDPNSSLTLSGARLTISPNASADTVETVLSTTIEAGASTLVVNKSAGSANATLHLNAITRVAGGTLNIIYGGSGTGLASATTDNTNANGILGGWITVNGTSWAVNSTNAADGAITGLTTYVNDAFSAANNTDITIAGANPGNPAATTNSLRFNQFGAKTLGLGNNAKTVTSGGILITSNVGAFTTTINGTSLRAASGVDLTIHQYNTSGDVILNAIITTLGGGGLVKSGSGLLVLGGVNTFTGAVAVNQGVLSVSTVADAGVSSNLGAGSAILLGDGASIGTLYYTGATASTNRSVTLGAAGGVVAVSTAASTLTFSGVVDGSGSLIKYGAGGLTLSGANTFTGATLVLGGTLTLDYAAQNNAKIDAASTLTLASAKLNVTPNADADTLQSVLSLTLSSGASTITVTKNAAANNATLNLNTITRTGAATVNFAYVGTGTGVAAITTDNANVSSILGGWATFNGTDWAVNATNGADGRIEALAPSAYYTTTTGGTTQGNYSARHVDVTSTVTMAAQNFNPATIRFNTAGAFTLTLTGNNNTVGSSGILVTANVGSSLSTIAGGRIRGPAGGDLIIHQYNTAGALTISAVIADNGGTRLVKTGPGVLNLTTTANSLFTGGVVVNQGTLNRNTVNAIPNDAASVITIRDGGVYVHNFDSANGYIGLNPFVIEAGGILTNGGSYFTTLSDVTLSGGTINAAGGRNANFNSWGFRGTVTVNGEVTSTIAASGTGTPGIQLGHGGTGNEATSVSSVTFDVADGAAQTDLLISAVIRNARNFDNTDFVASSLIKNGAGRLLASGNNTFTGNVTVNAGTLHFTGSNLFAGTVTVNGGLLHLAGTTAFTNGAAINGGSLLVSDSGTLQNVATNVITVNSGTSFIFGRNNVYGAYNAVPVAPIVVEAGGTVTNNGAFFNVLGPLTLNGGTLTSVAGFNTTLPSWGLKGTVTVNGGAATSTISGSGTNAGVTLGQAELTGATFDVADGSAAVDLLISAVLSDGRNSANTAFQASSLTKTGAGLLSLSAANTFTGAVQVQAGTLALTSTGSVATSPLIEVTSGALLDVTAHTSGYTLVLGQTLVAGRTSGFAPDVLGSLVNQGTLSPGGDNVKATLTLSGDLVLQGGGQVRFDFGADGTLGGGVNDLIDILGTLNASGVTTIVAPSSVPVSGVTYTLFRAASLGTVTAANFAFGSSGTRQVYTFDTTSTPGSVLLTATGSAANLIWTGAVDGNWDVDTTTNWTGSPDQKFFNLDNVTFNDSSTVGTVLLAGQVQPLSVVVDNAATSYTFTGVGSITGTTGIVKTGAGLLTIATQNTFTGAVEIREGTLSADTIFNSGSASSLGAGTSVVLGSATTAGTLRYTGASSTITNKNVTLAEGGGAIEVTDALAALVISGPVSGGGDLTKSGDGVLMLSGLNDYTGTLTISGGTFRAGSVSALGSVAGGTVIQSGATLDVFGFNLGTEQVSVGGAGVGGLGAIINTGAQQLNALRSVTLTGDASVGGSGGRWDIRGTGTAGTSTLNLAGFKLTKVGTNYVGLVNTTVSSGDIDINEGTLAFLQGADVTGTGTITLASGATLSVGNYNVGNTITRAIVSNGGTISGEGAANQSPALASPITLNSGTTTITSPAPTFTVNGGVSGSGNLALTSSGGSVVLVTQAGNAIGGSLTAGTSTTLNIAGTGVAGAFSVQGPVEFSGGTLRFDLSSNTASGNDQLLLGSSLTLTGTTTIQVAALNPSLTQAPGSYTLISGASSVTGDASNLALTGIPANTRQTFTLDTTTTPGSVLLNVAGSTAALTWAGPGAWDVNNSQVWNGGTEKFFTWDSVTFDDTSANGVVALNSQVTPSSVTVNNTNTSYTISGTGGIIGTGSLLKDGAGVLTLSAANTFSGGAVIRAGEVRITAANAIGTGAITLGDAGTGSSNISLYSETNRIQFARAIIVSSQGTGTVTIGSRGTVVGTGDNNNFSNITLQRDVIFDSNANGRTDYRNITGTGGIRVIGAARSIIGGTNTFVGDVTVATTGSGYLQSGAGEDTPTNFIPDASSVTVEGGARFALGSVAETIGGLNGSGLVNVQGISGTLTIGGGDGTGDFSGTLADTGGNILSLVKTGSGVQVLSGTSSYTGGTVVDQGTLVVANTFGTATGSGNVTVTGTAKLGGTGIVGNTTGIQSSNITIGDGTNAATLFVGNLSGDTTGKTLTLGAGELDSTGVITLATGSVLEVDIFSQSDSDRLILFSDEAVVLNGSLRIRNATGDAGFFTNLTSGTWQLIDWTNVVSSSKYTGGFSNLGSGTQGANVVDLPALGAGYGWDWSNLYTTGQISIVVVPEPSRVLLLLGSATWVLLLRRRRGNIVDR